MSEQKQQRAVYVPPCDGCHNCGHLYDGNRNEFFAWKWMRWLCQRCCKKMGAI